MDAVGYTPILLYKPTTSLRPNLSLAFVKENKVFCTLMKTDNSSVIKLETVDFIRPGDVNCTLECADRMMFTTTEQGLYSATTYSSQAEIFAFPFLRI